jgi:hypothetical protein
MRYSETHSNNRTPHSMCSLYSYHALSNNWTTLDFLEKLLPPPYIDRPSFSIIKINTIVVLYILSFSFFLIGDSKIKHPDILTLSHFRKRAGILGWYNDWMRAARSGYGGFDSRRGWLEIFLFSTASRPVLGPTQSPIQMAPGALFPGVKRPWREADHSPSYAEVKNTWR